MIIGISGKMGSGKDTVADMLLELLQNAVKIRFADGVKQIAAVILQEPIEKFEDADFKKSQLSEKWKVFVVELPSGDIQLFATEKEANDLIHEEGGKCRDYLLTVRELLTLIGTDFGRNKVHPNIWIYQTLSRAASNAENNVLTIIPDVRFLNEKHAIENSGGIVLRVNRTDNMEYAGSSSVLLHSSETELDNEHFTHMIVNDGSLIDLKNKVSEFIYGVHCQAI